METQSENVCFPINHASALAWNERRISVLCGMGDGSDLIKRTFTPCQAGVSSTSLGFLFHPFAVVVKISPIAFDTTPFTSIRFRCRRSRNINDTTTDGKGTGRGKKSYTINNAMSVYTFFHRIVAVHRGVGCFAIMTSPWLLCVHIIIM
jgi:hypothetical protein